MSAVCKLGFFVAVVGMAVLVGPGEAQAQFTKKRLLFTWPNPNATDQLQVTAEYGTVQGQIVNGTYTLVFTQQGVVGPFDGQPIMVQMGPNVVYNGYYGRTIDVPSAQNRWCRGKWEKNTGTQQNPNWVLLGYTDLVSTTPPNAP